MIDHNNTPAPDPDDEPQREETDIKPKAFFKPEPEEAEEPALDNLACDVETDVEGAPEPDAVSRLQLAYTMMAKDALGLVLQDLSEQNPGQRPTLAIGPMLQSMKECIENVQTAFAHKQQSEAAGPLAILMFQSLVLSAVTDVECLKSGSTSSALMMARNLIPKERDEASGPWPAHCTAEGCDWEGETYEADCPNCGEETVEFEGGEEAPDA